MERVIDGRRFKVWRLPHPLLLHWVLNPGLAVNELALGQRVPRQTLIEQDVDGTLEARQHVVCPHCGALTSWLTYKAAGLQFGLYRGIPCRACSQEIPQTLNALSWLVLTPLRALPGAARRRAATLARQADRLRAAEGSEAASDDEAVTGPRSWIKQGLTFGAFMTVFFAVSNATDGSGWREGLPAALAGGMIAGLLFGGAMALFARVRRRDRQRGDPS